MTFSIQYVQQIKDWRKIKILNIDVTLPGHTFVNYKIETDEQLALELAEALDLIVSEIVKSKRELSEKQNLGGGLQYRNHILQMIENTEFCYSECYTDRDMILYEE